MNGNETAIDTNVAIAILNDGEEAVKWLSSFKRVYLPIPVVGELRFGALKSARVSANMHRVDLLVEACTCLPITDDTTRHYAEIRTQLRGVGAPIPSNDLWIAACCVEHGVTLTTSDAHFTRVVGLTTAERGF